MLAAICTINRITIAKHRRLQDGRPLPCQFQRDGGRASELSIGGTNWNRTCQIGFANVPTKYGSTVAIAMVRQSNIGWPLSKKSYRLSVPQPCQALRQSGSGAARHLNDPRDEFLGARLRARREPLSKQPLSVPEDIFFSLTEPE